jgi:hypothetical protein
MDCGISARGLELCSSPLSRPIQSNRRARSNDNAPPAKGLTWMRQSVSGALPDISELQHCIEILRHAEQPLAPGYCSRRKSPALRLVKRGFIETTVLPALAPRVVPPCLRNRRPPLAAPPERMRPPPFSGSLRPPAVTLAGPSIFPAAAPGAKHRSRSVRLPQHRMHDHSAPCRRHIRPAKKGKPI